MNFVLAVAIQSREILVMLSECSLHSRGEPSKKYEIFNTCTPPVKEVKC